MKRAGGFAFALLLVVGGLQIVEGRALAASTQITLSGVQVEPTYAYRCCDQSPPLAIDGDTGSFTYTTESGTSASPAYLEIGFASASPLNRIRVLKDTDQDAYPHTIFIQTTTGTGALESRSWTTVSGMTSGFNGAEQWVGDVSSNGTVTNDDQTVRDGFRSLSFDTVDNATGVRIGFTYEEPNCCNHYVVYEFQAWHDEPSVNQPPQTTTTLSPASPDGNNGYYVSDVHATVSATDEDGPGVSEIRCSLDQAPAPAAFGDIAEGCAFTGSGADVTTDGTHKLYVAANDTAGAASAVTTTTFKMDTTTPDVTIDSKPPSVTQSTTADFTFSSTESGVHFGCYLDNVGEVCDSGSKEYTGLAEGSHTFHVFSQDDAGNAPGTPASYTWTVDTTPPTTQIDVKPGDPSGPSVEFGFSSSEANSTFTCDLDGSVESCSPNKGYSNLSSGSHTFTVTATDAAGNADTTGASYNWTVDATAPETQIDSHPTNPSNDTSPDFTFSSTGGGTTFKCKLDTGAEESCDSGSKSYTGVGDGSHTFSVYATDAVGNADTSPSTYTWTVDATAPDTQILTGPADDSTSGPDVHFTFSSNDADAGFECQIDSGTAEDCDDGSQDYTGLSGGSHTFTVTAIDTAGNADTSPESVTWNVDATGPTVTITGPKKTTKRRPKFTLTSEPGATFECNLDNEGFASCDSPFQPATKLKYGKHTLVVRATDSVGNVGPDSATKTFKIIRKK